MKFDYLILAIDGLKKRKLRSWLTMIGIFIGIAAVVSLIGLGEGLRTAITGQFGFLGTDVLGVQAAGVEFGPPGSGAANPLTDDLAEKIARIPGVKGAFNRYIKTGMVEVRGITDIGMFWSMPEGEDRKEFERMLNLKVDEGRLLREGDRYKVLVGYDVAHEQAENTFGKELKVGDNIQIDGVKAEIVGIMEKKGSFIFDGALAMNEGPLLELFGDDGTVNTLAVIVKDEKEIDKVKEDIEKLLRKERNVKEGEEDFSVATPQQALESLNSVLFAIQMFVTIIAIISLLVGGIGIMNTMYTSVLERTKEIGIMKSIGAKNSTIFSLFFLESGLLGSVGGAIGIIIGMSIAYGLAGLGRALLGSDLIQAKVSFGLITGSLAFSFILGTFFGVLPAIQASRLQPVDALRSV